MTICKKYNKTWLHVVKTIGVAEMLNYIKRSISRLYNILSVLIFYINGENKRNRKKLGKLKNSYLGKRIFIICNGPSLRAEDLQKIYKNGDISIAMNAIARIYNQTLWRPTFLSLTDDIVFTRKNTEICRTCECKYKFYDRSRYLKSLNSKGKKFYLGFNESYKLLDEPIFDPDATKMMPSIGTSAYACIEFAVFLGCSEIYILGCDMSYAVNITRDGKIYYNESGKEHFYGTKYEDIKTSNIAPVPIWQLEVAFDTAAKYAKENNIKIYNATRGGKLESFPRVEFDNLF